MHMKRFGIPLMILFFCCLIQIGYAQCPNKEKFRLIYQAEYKLDVNKNYKGALELYNLAEYKYNTNMVNFGKMEIYSRLNKRRLFRKIFVKEMKNGNSFETIYNNLENKHIRISTKDSIYLSKKEADARGIYYTKADVHLLEKINYWYNTDQYFAKENFDGGRKNQHITRSKIFQNNLAQLKKYIEEENNGILPQYNQIGSKKLPIIVMLLHHTRLNHIDTLNYNFFEKKLKEEVCLRDTYSPITYIQFVDNMQLVMESGEKQIYGHYIDWKKKQIYPLKYPDKVNSLRAELGLLSIEEYAEMKNVKLPENYPFTK